MVRHGVQLHTKEDLAAVKGQIDCLNLKPSLIVVDTLAKCFVGGNENDATEAGVFTAGVQNLAETYGATVIVLHHTNKPREGKTQARGSGAFIGNLDVVMKVDRKKGSDLVLSCEKQKEAAEFADIALRLVEVPTVGGRTSCIVMPSEAPAHDGIGGEVRLALLAWSACELPSVSSAAWRKMLESKFGKGESTFYRYRKAVVGTYIAEDAEGNYILTNQGAATLKLLS